MPALTGFESNRFVEKVTKMLTANVYSYTSRRHCILHDKRRELGDNIGRLVAAVATISRHGTHQLSIAFEIYRQSLS